MKRMVLLGVLSVACRTVGADDTSKGVDTAKAVDTAPAPRCLVHDDPVSVGELSSADLPETSGLAASRLGDDLLWLHNDSGDQARLFAIETSGALRATLTLDGTFARDWEDAAIGIDPANGLSTLFVGDIGDNARVRSEIIIHRLLEPPLDEVSEGGAFSVTEFDTFQFTYPKSPRDSEALAYDSVTGDLFILTKPLLPETTLFVAHPPFESGKSTELEEVGSLDLTEQTLDGISLVTGADISPDGQHLLVRTYGDVFSIPRESATTHAEWLSNAACPQPTALEQQGEAISFSADGGGYFTISEGAFPPVYRYVAVEKP